MLLVFVLVLAFHAVVFVLLAYMSSAILAGIVIACALAAQWWWGDRAALKALDARVISTQEWKALHGTVERLCVLANMPKPAIAISHRQYPNAFAVGRSPSHSTLCVTTGLLSTLDDDELETVLAHELAHIAHRDVVVMTGAASFRLLFEALGRVVDGNNVETPADRGRPRLRLWMIVFWFYVLIYLISGLLGSTLSRYRELSADRSAAYLTGNPSALASALTKLSGPNASIPDRDLRDVGSVGEMMIVPVRQVGGLRSIFKTHPPVSDRLDVLGAVAADLGRPLT